jgi:hypothetical protein
MRNDGDGNKYKREVIHPFDEYGGIVSGNGAVGVLDDLISHIVFVKTAL